MLKMIILVFFSFVFLFSVNFVQASVIINEVMYNPLGNEELGKRDWIEIKNTGSSPIDLTEKVGAYSRWRFSKGSDNYQLASFNESKEILPGGYAVIVSDPSYFLIDYPNFSGVIFDSSNFSLTDTTTTIGIKDTSNDILEQLTYIPNTEATDTGNSLQSMGGELKPANPTPGEQNSSVVQESGESFSGSSSSVSSNSSSENTTQTTVSAKTKIIENPTMKAKILANNLVFTGQPFEIETDVSGFSNENVVLGRVYWNFGDGSSFEQINNFEKFYHTYYYAGEYVVFLEYYKNTFSKVPEITNKMTIKVVPTTVSISKVGDMKDFFIELTNNASSDIDVSNWVINANGKIFILPKNSVIISKRQMTISSKITGFIYGDQYNLKLFSPTNDLIFDYSTSLINKNIPKVAFLKTNTISTNASTNESKNENNMPSFINLNTVNKNNADSVLDGQVPIDNLGAEVIKSDIPINNNFKYGVFGLIAFLGVSTSAAYVIRNRGKKIVSKANGDDFEIIDE